MDFNEPTGERSFYIELINCIRRNFPDVTLLTTSGNKRIINENNLRVLPVSPINPPRLFKVTDISSSLLRGMIFTATSSLIVLIYILLLRPTVVVIRHSLLCLGISQVLRTLRIKSIADGDISSDVFKEYSKLKLSDWVISLLQTLERITVNSYSCIRVANYDLCKRFMKCGVPKTKIWIQPPGININKIPYNPPTKSNSHVFGFFGYITEWQGLQFFLPILKKLRRRIGDAELVIIGEGPYLPEIKKLTKKLGLQRVVNFVPPMRRALLLTEGLKMFGIMVIPRISSPGGIPMKMIEAMAAGKPVIIFKSPEWPNYFTEENGFIVIDRSDIPSTLQRLEQLMNDYDKLLSLSSRAREFSKKFDINRIVSTIYALSEGSGNNSSVLSEFSERLGC